MQRALTPWGRNVALRGRRRASVTDELAVHIFFTFLVRLFWESHFFRIFFTSQFFHIFFTIFLGKMQFLASQGQLPDPGPRARLQGPPDPGPRTGSRAQNRRPQTRPRPSHSTSPNSSPHRLRPPQDTRHRIQTSISFVCVTHGPDS